MRFVLSAIGIVISACAHHSEGPDIGPWPVAPATRVRAVADDPSLTVAWDAELRANINDFNFGLGAPGCDPPFVMVFPSEPADHDIVLVSSSTDSRLEPGLQGGESDDGWIVIHGRPSSNWQRSPLRGIIAHELGHAVGLGHGDPAFGLSAMTTPPDTQLRARDVAAMACFLACGPCDPTSDPYTSP